MGGGREDRKGGGVRGNKKIVERERERELYMHIQRHDLTQTIVPHNKGDKKWCRKWH